MPASGARYVSRAVVVEPARTASATVDPRRGRRNRSPPADTTSAVDDRGARYCRGDARSGGAKVRRAAIAARPARAAAAASIILPRVVAARETLPCGSRARCPALTGIAIAASVLGGTSLSGGIGTIGGTLIGAFVIGVLNDGMIMYGVSDF